MSCSRSKSDTLCDIDERYLQQELDVKLQHNKELFGSRRIGIAVIGVGRMGAIHMFNVTKEPRAKLHYILDSSHERLNYFRKKYFLDDHNVKCVMPEQFEQILNDPKVEALLISTPTYTHEHYVKLGLEHGKHILCEKPLADKLEDVEILVKLAEAKGLKLICAFNRRYDHSFRKIYDQVRRGDVGRVRMIKTCSRDSPFPTYEYMRTSGGIFHDCSVHDIDLILWISRELPTEVHSFVHCYDETLKSYNDFDTVLITLKFPSGLLACCDQSRLSPSGYEQRIEVLGERGLLKLDECCKLGCERHDECGVTKPNQCYSFSSRYQEAYANEISELFNHIEGNKVWEPLNGPYLTTICKLTNALEQSAREKRPVTLEWTDEEKSHVV